MPLRRSRPLRVCHGLVRGWACMFSVCGGRAWLAREMADQRCQRLPAKPNVPDDTMA